MELLIEEGSIAKRIKHIKPTHIATAYIGRQWNTYIEAAALEAVVLSPTLGSSAKAIWDLVEQLGWGKVHFLDELHAKFYWSPKAAVLGSSNLSNNGLQGAGGLIEAAVSMTAGSHPDQHAQLIKWHRSLVKRAKEAYPTIATKREQLKWLERVQHQASLIDGYPNFGVAPSKALKKGRDIKDYDQKFKQERIHVLGWGYLIDHDSDGVKAQMTTETPKALKHALGHYISVSEKDIVQPGDWVLVWETNPMSWEPKDDGDVSWVHVDYLLKTTSREVGADPFVAHECRAMRDDEVPFLLTKEVKQVLRALLASGTFSELAPKEPDVLLSLKDANKRVPAFIGAMKKGVAALINRN